MVLILLKQLQCHFSVVQRRMFSNLKSRQAQMFLCKVSEFSDLALLVAFESEICGVNVLHFVKLESLNVINQRMSDQNWLLLGLCLKQFQNMRNVLFDFGESWGVTKELLINSMNVVHRFGLNLTFSFFH